eukprot:scaffold3664_cov407-Prasinococcus_capsulatus_cf.AAC.7
MDSNASLRLSGPHGPHSTETGNPTKTKQFSSLFPRSPRLHVYEAGRKVLNDTLTSTHLRTRLSWFVAATKKFKVAHCAGQGDSGAAWMIGMKIGRL